MGEGTKREIPIITNHSIKKRVGQVKPLNNPRIISQDPLYELSDEEKWRVWSARDTIKDNEKALPKFLKSANWRLPYGIGFEFI
jgi:hypothetical protein